MYPRFQLGDSTVESYPLFFIAGWLIGGAIFYREVKRRGWPLEKLLFAMCGCVFGAVIGAVSFGVLFFDWPEVIARASALELVGKSVVGGIFGGFAGVEVAKKIVGYPHSTGDAFALAIPIGHAVGRIGCVLGGCCFGSPTSMPWGLEFPRESPVFAAQLASGLIAADHPRSLPVHPTQLYELVFDLALFALLFALRDRFAIRGTLFRVYLLAYAAARFALEFIRADSPFPAIGGPKPIQIILLVAVIRYAWVLRANAKRGAL